MKARPASRRHVVAAPARSWRLAALLAALSMLGPFAIDMYLPAFDAIERDLATTAIAVQQTLSTYLFAYAFMMLWHGALSDALGRRPIVIAGLAVFALASLGAAIAGNIHTLWLWRALQGLSAGEGLVVGRAIVRDCFHGAEAQRLMSQITMVFSVAPALAPVIGGVLLNLMGWRAIFWMMTLFALLVTAWAVRDLPETLDPGLRQQLDARSLWRNYRAVLSHADFLLLAGIPTFNFAAFFVYIAGAPAYLARLGVTTWGFAWLFVPMIAGVMVGGFLSGRVAGRLTPHATIATGFGVIFVAVTINAAMVAFVPPGVPWHVLPIFVYTLGSSLLAPSVMLSLLEIFPTMRGLASSLQGFLQFAVSGVVAGTVAPLLSTSLGALAAGMAGFSAVGAGLWMVYATRHRRASPAT